MGCSFEVALLEMYPRLLCDRSAVIYALCIQLLLSETKPYRVVINLDPYQNLLDLVTFTEVNCYIVGGVEDF